MSFNVGDQIVRLPSGVDDPGHSDAEYGFVSSAMNQELGYVFCRYWRRGEPGVLRTVANGERTPIENLYPYKSVADEVVSETITAIVTNTI